MRLQAQHIKVGDFLVWDSLMVDAPPAEVLHVVQKDVTVAITYKNREGRPEVYEYPTGELLEIAEKLGDKQ